jgi:glyoxylase I family protein
MEKVTGIGGVFFKAKDPEALARWYRDHLGITLTPTSYDEDAWRQEAGVTIFQPYSEGSWKGPREWRLNFRVRDLEAMAKQLEAAGIQVKVDPEVYPNGQFASTADPEGNPIEIWQPMGPAAK